jgi:hypothetical protein
MKAGQKSFVNSSDIRTDMIEIRRLNMDNSWQIRWDGSTILLDPWLIGSEIDGFSWFNEQWHVTEPVSLGDTGTNDIVIVSQPYSDHCHAETIRKLAYTSLLAVKPARKRLIKELAPGVPEIPEIPDAKYSWLKSGNLEIAKLSPDRWIDPIYHAILIKKGKEAICYAPHGFALNKAQLAVTGQLDVRLLITTFTHFRLPAVLGGVINMGVDGMQKLADQIKPAHIINTHDEQKQGKGLVMKIAKAAYANIAELSRADSRIIHLDSYDWITI